jgi:stress-induced morphogen
MGGFEMGVIIRGKTDDVLEQFKQRLLAYRAHHPQADIVLYRQNSASIRIRIIDPEFTGLDRVQRNDLIWTFLDGLDNDVLFHLTILLLLTPREAGKSLANEDFEQPVRARS